MATIKIPQPLYVAIQVEAERMSPPMSATRLILTHLYKAFPSGDIPSLASVNTPPAPAVHNMQYAPGDLRNTMGSKEIAEHFATLRQKRVSE